MQIPRNIVSWPKSNNYVLVGILAIVCVQQPPYHFLQTLHPLRMFKIVFRDSSLIRNNCFYFGCWGWSTGSADRSGYITIFCNVIELLHEFKKSFFKQGRIQEVDNVSAGKSENWQFAGLLCIIKNWKFSCVLHAHSQFLWSFARFDNANRGVRQPVQPHTFYARLLVFDKTSAASFCSCKLLGRGDGFVLLPVLTCSLIFLHLWTAVSWRWLYFPPIS